MSKVDAWNKVKASDALRIHHALSAHVRLYPDQDASQEYYEVCKEVGIGFKEAECLAYDVAENFEAFMDKAKTEGIAA